MTEVKTTNGETVRISRRLLAQLSIVLQTAGAEAIEGMGYSPESVANATK